VSQGLAITLAVLAETDNEAAVRLLIAALDSPHPEVAEGALRAVLARRSPAGQRQVVARLDTLGEAARRIVRNERGSLSRALRDAVLDSDPRTSANACEAILWLEEYDLVPVLVNAVEDERNGDVDRTTRTLVELVARLDEELALPAGGEGRRDLARERQAALLSLEHAAARYGKHCRAELIEAFLILAARDNGPLLQILGNPHLTSYLPVLDCLMHCLRPGVVRLLLSFLDDEHAPSAGVSALARRGDRPFVSRVLARIGESPSDAVVHNIKRMDAFPWARPPGILAELDGEEQRIATRLVMTAGVKRSEAYRTIEWLVRFGRPEGRRAAAAALAEFNGAEANRLCLAALDDADPLVQAAAVRHLRQRGIPSALARLLDLVESPHASVREAVAECLTEFRFPGFLARFDQLDEDARRSTAELVLKLDREAVSQLQAELTSPVRGRRLRGIQMADALAAAPEVEGELVALAGDEDHLVRLEAVGLLAELGSMAARGALEAALADSSVLVRERARRGLERTPEPASAPSREIPSQRTAATEGPHHA
jgi:HEAT repeat protein